MSTNKCTRRVIIRCNEVVLVMNTYLEADGGMVTMVVNVE